MSLRILHSIETEQSLLGALMLDGDTFDVVASIVSAGDFYSDQHRYIWRSIAELLAAGKPADPVSVAGHLEERGTLEDVGGREYIAELYAAVPGVSSAKSWAQIVRDRAVERRLVAAGDQIMSIAADTGPLAERVDRAQAIVESITESAVTGGPEPIGVDLYGFIDELERRHEKQEDVTGLRTELEGIDKKLSGLQKGDLVVVAGRPSMGKTSLVLQWAERVACRGETALFFSAEMKRSQIALKAVSNIGRISLEKIRTGRLDADDFSRVSAVMARLEKAPLFIDDTGGISIDQIRVRSRSVKRKHGLSLIAVDYLQLLTADGEHREQQIAAVSRALKALAKELDVPVVALSQLNRSLEQRQDKRPMMSDLRESGAIEQDADVIIFIYRDEVYNPNSDAVGIAELIVAKQRMGPIGMVPAAWHAEYGSFGDVDWRRPDREERKPARVVLDDF